MFTQVQKAKNMYNLIHGNPYKSSVGLVEIINAFCCLKLCLLMGTHIQHSKHWLIKKKNTLYLSNNNMNHSKWLQTS